MARRNSRFINQKVIIGDKSIQASDLTDSARDTLSVDSDFVKDVIFKLDSDFVNLGLGLDGASIRDSSITPAKFTSEVASALVADALISGRIYKVTEYNAGTSITDYTVDDKTQGALFFVQGASGGGGGGALNANGQALAGGGGGGASGGFYKLGRADLETVNIIQVGNPGTAGAAGNAWGGGSGSGGAGGITKIATANASLIESSGGGGGGGCGANSNGGGGSGGVASFNSGVSLFTYGGNAGANGASFQSTNVGGAGGNRTKTDPLSTVEIGVFLSLYRLAADSDAPAQDILSSPDLIGSATGGSGGRIRFNPGYAGNDGLIIMYEFT